MVHSVETPTPTDAPPEAETRLLTDPVGPIAICPGWQVAFDRLQWILQHWQAPRWRDRAFCRTRAGLELRIRELLGKEHQAAVAHLPDWHPDVAEVSEPAVSSSDIAHHPVDHPFNSLAAVLTAPLQPTIDPVPLITGILLQGDDYPIELDADGDPVLPACLDRRVKPAPLKEAAA
jgi:hypothetical protein